MNYMIEYELGGEQKSEEVECSNTGAAFAMVLRHHPAAKLKHATAFGKCAGKSQMKIEYDPPPVQRDPVPSPRPPRPLKPEDRTCVLPFYDEAKSRRREQFL